jgi:hypothetical protein
MAAGKDLVPVSRTRLPEDGTERDTLTGLLDFLRATAVNKVVGLSDEQAFATPSPPSRLTPAGVVKHLAGTERFWFSIDFAGADLPLPWPDDNPHGNFAITPADTLAEIVASYQDECVRSSRVVAEASLEDRARGPEMAFTLRFALAHMIEETARHCGHLDLLRQAIDGQVGM